MKKTENIFKSNIQQENHVESVKYTEALVKVKKDNWIRKTIEKIKKLLKKHDNIWNVEFKQW